jgi:hypothetical protein
VTHELVRARCRSSAANDQRELLWLGGLRSAFDGYRSAISTFSACAMIGSSPQPGAVEVQAQQLEPGGKLLVPGKRGQLAADGLL